MTMHCLVIESLGNSTPCILSGVLVNGLARIGGSLAKSQTSLALATSLAKASSAR